MRDRILYALIILMVTLSLTLFWGCDYQGEQVEPLKPFVNLYSVPPDSSVLNAAPTLWWWGTDKDGRIIAYEFIDIPKSKVSNEVYNNLVSNYKTDPSIPDSVEMVDGYTKWQRTTSNADTIYLSLEEGEDTTEHLFCVRSIDSDSLKSDETCMIYFRTNEPPDSMKLTEFDNYPEGDTFWVLTDFTDDWDGIPFSWRAHDPDNSVILEYYWWVEEYDNPDNIVRTSLSEDSLGGVYAGADSTDGWVRSTKTTLKGVDTGHWRFIIKVRDDAFYEGVQDTFEFYAVHPYFDPSESLIVEEIYNGTFEHRLLFIYNTDGWQEEMWTDFYEPILQQFVSEGYITSFDRVSTSDDYLSVDKFTMKDYSIIYFYHLGGILSAGVFRRPSEVLLDELRDYVIAGWRVIFDGRQFFYNITAFVNAYSPLGQIPYDMFGITWQCSGGNKLYEATASHPSYEDLKVDETKIASGSVSGIMSVGLYPYFSGVPYTEVLYNAAPYEDADSAALSEFIGLPVACRFAKTNTRTAFFSFPLYAMDNSDGSVTAALDSTFSFLTTTFNPEEEEEQGLLRRALSAGF